MRELTVRLRFTKHCLGNTKAKDESGRFLFPRNPMGEVIFMSTWHQANMRFAAQVLGRHHDEVQKIMWDITVDGNVPRNRYRRYPNNDNRKFVEHECFYPGQTIGINCVVPETISDDDFRQLMQLAGTYRGLSPYHPTKNGFFEVVSMNLRRRKPAEGDTNKDENTTVKQNEAKTVPMS